MDSDPTSGLRRHIPRALRLLLYEASPRRRRLWRRFPAPQQISPAGGRVALTFDDGPGTVIWELLSRLAEHELPATFFMVAEQLAAHPDGGRAVLAAGHEVALHGAEHFRHDRSSPERSRDDVLRGVAQVESILRVRPRWYRPPFGKFSAASFEACREAGLRPVYWSTWGYDWEAVGARRIAWRVGCGLRSGAIVLLHDAAHDRENGLATVEAIALIAAKLRRKRLTAVTLSHPEAFPQEAGPILD